MYFVSSFINLSHDAFSKSRTLQQNEITGKRLTNTTFSSPGAARRGAARLPTPGEDLRAGRGGGEEPARPCPRSAHGADAAQPAAAQHLPAAPLSAADCYVPPPTPGHQARPCAGRGRGGRGPDCFPPRRPVQDATLAGGDGEPA